MHFTREPIIETIISARDGHKLVLKSSKTSGQTEISTEVIEVVSFSGALFYRSQDRSKNFLLPASDFEVSEVKDARLVLKNISLEKSNKLTNPAKEAVIHEPSDENVAEDLAIESEAEGDAVSTSTPASSNHRVERRRERRRNRRRRHGDDRGEERKEQTITEPAAISETTGESSAVFIPPTLNLIPPPTTLISQTLARYKDLVQEEPSTPSVAVENNPDQGSMQEPLEPEDLV